MAYGMEYLKTKLLYRQVRVRARYSYYEQKHRPKDFGMSTPPQLAWYRSVIGWCSKSVDCVADRLIFRGFAPDLDTFGLNDIYKLNNKNVLADSAILGALISSCSFIYISADEVGYPRMQVIDGYNATGIIDPNTNLLLEGYAVLERDQNRIPTLEAYFLPGETTFYAKGEEPRTVQYDCQYPLLVPVINRPDAIRPFGHSRISRACMNISDAAMREVKRSEISSEFYSFPQRFVTGLDPDAEKMDKWRATISAMMAFEKDADGQSPNLGQFQQASMTPHVDLLRMYAGLFSAESGLTLDDLGVPQTNPSSSEAIRASHENLRLTCRKAQRDFETALINAGYIAACVRDKRAYYRNQFVEERAKWEPIFEPDVNAISGIGDAIQKINLALPDYLKADEIRDLTGVGTDSLS